MEQWKQIEGYEGIYEISDLGRVRSLTRKVKHSRSGYITVYGKVLKQEISYRGYKKIMLYDKNNKRKKYFTHQIVASAFLENFENKPYVNHIDGNKLNNCFKNLEWCTHKENIKHALENDLIPYGENRYNSKLKNKEVRQIIHLINLKYTLLEISNIYNVSISCISGIKNGKNYNSVKERNKYI